MMEENPFPDLKVTSSDFLNEVSERSICTQCGKSRKFYCYTCYLPIAHLKGKWPYVELPLKITIIKHPNEIDGKSTAAHVATMAPNQVNVYIYPQMPEFKDPSKILLIFPGDGAPTFEEYVKRSCSPKPSISCGDHEPSDDEDDDITNLHNEESEDLQTIASNINTCETQQALTCSGVKRRINAEESEPPKKRKNRQLWQADNIEEVIFIDSTWYQVHKIKRDERLKDLQRIELKTQKTRFWRHQQDKPDTYLSTAEAIYYFLREYHEYFIETDYQSEYDDLLFLFCFMYRKIKHLYDGGKKIKAYTNSRKQTKT